MKKFKVLFSMVLVILLAGITFAASPSTLKPNVWNADQTFNHGVNFDGAVDFDSTVDFTGATITATGLITSTHIADITRSIPLQTVAAALNTAGTITAIGDDGTTAPGIGAADGIPAIIYAASSEVASIGWTFQIPADFSSSLSFRMIVSTDTDTSYANWGFAWNLYVNNPSVAFDATPYSQSNVTNSVSTPSASNVLLTFTADATAAADIAAGDTVTVWFSPVDTRASGTIETKSLEARYTAVQ